MDESYDDDDDDDATNGGFWSFDLLTNVIVGRC